MKTFWMIYAITLSIICFTVPVWAFGFHELTSLEGFGMGIIFVAGLHIFVDFLGDLQ